MHASDGRDGESILFPGPEAIRNIESELSQLIEHAIGTTADRPVSPDIDLSRFRSQLASKTFEEPEDLSRLLAWVVESMAGGLVQVNHPKYFGLFNPSPALPAICADRIAAAFNPQICVWSHAPAAVEMEQHVVSRLAGRAGLPDGSGGHFTSGGSEANNTAAICALTAAEPGFAENGVRAFKGPPAIYVSRESHLAWLKIAHQLGIGRAAVKLIETDGRGRMNPAALSDAIESDIADGDIPAMIAATAGTTNAGAVDPLHACADVARDNRSERNASNIDLTLIAIDTGNGPLQLNFLVGILRLNLACYQ